MGRTLRIAFLRYSLSVPISTDFGTRVKETLTSIRRGLQFADLAFAVKGKGLRVVNGYHCEMCAGDKMIHEYIAGASDIILEETTVIKKRRQKTATKDSDK